MKKIIITESQRDALEKFILEADNEKKTKIGELDKEFKNVTANVLKKAKIGQVISITVGKSDANNKLIKESVASYVALVRGKTPNELILSLITTIGKPTYKIPVKTDLGLFFNNSIITSMNGVRLNLSIITGLETVDHPEVGQSEQPQAESIIGDELLDEASKQKKIQRKAPVAAIKKIKQLNTANEMKHKAIVINDLISIKTHQILNISGLQDELTAQTAADTQAQGVNQETGTEAPKVLGTEVVDSVVGQGDALKSKLSGEINKEIADWDAKLDNILKSMEFQPASMGMNNFLFFPKGYAAMDNILNKYHMPTPKSRYKTSNANSLIGITSNDVLGKDNSILLDKTKEYKCYHNTTSHYFAIDHEDGKIMLKYKGVLDAKNVEVPVEASFVPEGEPNYNKGIKLNPTKIKVIRF